MGLDEKSAVTTWQKVLLFRQYFSDITNNIFLDQHSMKEFSKFALEAAQIKLYSLPKSLKLESFEDLVQLQVYINATSQENDYQTIPNNFLSIEEIEKNYPELVYQNYLAEISQSTIEEVALQVSIKEMIKWQLEEKNWNLLSSKFSKLKKANSSETRYSQLEKLDKESKDKIDHFSRLQITNDNSTSIDKALDFSKPQQFVFQIRKKGTVLPFADLKDQNELIDLIKNNEEISKYSADNKTFYKIKIVEKQNDKHLLSYKNAKDDSTLKNLTARYLNEKYLQMRDKYPVRFKNADDSYKSFASVKNDVAKIHFSDLLNNIEKYFNKKVSDQNEYASLFLSMHMSDIKSKIQNNSLKVADMDHQWRVVAEDKEIIRSKEKDWIQDKLFTMNKDSFSSLNFSETNGPQFFYIASFNEKKPSAEKIEKSKEGIINESKCLLAKKLVKQFFDNNNIILPIRVEAN